MGSRGACPGGGWVQGHGRPGLHPPGSRSWCPTSGLGLPHRMGSPGPPSQGPLGRATVCPSAHGPFGLHSLGRERRLSSRSRTVGRCSKGTGAGQVSLGGLGAVSSPWVRSASGLPFLGPSATRNQVTCLSVSTDGSVLLSGSHDETVRVWDVQSKQCIRTLTLKGGRAAPYTPASPFGHVEACGRGRQAWFWGETPSGQVWGGGPGTGGSSRR